MAGIDDINRYPVIHTWSYKLLCHAIRPIGCLTTTIKFGPEFVVRVGILRPRR